MPAKSTGVISGVRALAKRFDVSHVAVSKWLKHPDWSFGKGPWTATEIPLIKRWAAEVLRPANEPADSEEIDPNKLSLTTRAKLQKVIAETAGIKLKNKILAGEFVDKAESEARLCSILEMVKRNVLGVTVGTPYADEINSYFRKQLIEVFERLSA